MVPLVEGQLASQLLQFEARLLRRLDEHKDEVLQAILAVRTSASSSSKTFHDFHAPFHFHTSNVESVGVSKSTPRNAECRQSKNALSCNSKTPESTTDSSLEENVMPAMIDMDQRGTESLGVSKSTPRNAGFKQSKNALSCKPQALESIADSTFGDDIMPARIDADQRGAESLGVSTLTPRNVWLRQSESGLTCKSKTIEGNTGSSFGDDLTPAMIDMDKHVTEAELELIRHSIEGDGFAEFSNSRVQHIARSIVSSRLTKYIVTSLIISNAVSIGAQVHWAVKYPRMRLPNVFDYIEIGFLIVFALELVVRLIAEARHFISCENKHVHWNVMDVILVSHGIFDMVMKNVLFDTLDVGVMRLIRIARLTRVVRVIRVMRFFRDLRVMINGIVSTLKSLLWAICTIFIIIYIVSIVVVEVISNQLAAADPQDEDAIMLQRQFGSLFDTMFLLFQSISGGVDWDVVSLPLFRISTWMGAFFTTYVAFSLFCVLNVITGVFVDNSARISMRDEENLLLETIETRKQRISDMTHLFLLLSDGEESFSRRQFGRHAKDIRVQTQFAKLGITTYCLKGLFALLDFHKNGRITYDNFTMGIEMLHGGAKNIDIARLRSDVKALSREIRVLRQEPTNGS
eukprot:TRINITY_DN8171_c0_g2_i1.p1 TRINITY_DN8171_c0_g2~~TRINITY_DN8171_c0_g2_i1.p1  ORF type:complete len:655 (-),score=67.84 TRINITY_DN8171_c0_g2_i1:33-1925(-)